MKISYDEKQDRGEPIAYIDNLGALCIRAPAKNAIGLWVDGDRPYAPGIDCGLTWNPDAPHVTRRFYAGDTITLTF